MEQAEELSDLTLIYLNQFFDEKLKTYFQSPKIKIFSKMKKIPQVFTQGTSVQNFSQIPPFLKSPGSGQTCIQTLSDSSSTEVENKMYNMNSKFIQGKCEIKGHFNNIQDIHGTISKKRYRWEACLIFISKNIVYWRRFNEILGKKGHQIG